ncbi:MAG TPA: winged helix-turn-helix domain-containing protein [Thermoanaerobaculia bacterium]|nr:winged helix-turn-helix domain-containing protein [Thermoanaerobaculia bacterium]
MADLYRFDTFELDPRTGELRRHGELLPLQPQPAAVLSLLVLRAGDLVTRGEIQQAIWPDRTVDYEQGLNYAIRQIRSVTGDDAEKPRLIETLPRRGYRFVAPVEQVEPVGPAGAGRRLIPPLVLVVLLLVAVAASVIILRQAPAEPMPANPAAREAYLVARGLLDTRDEAVLRKARREFARVLELEPDFAPALVGLGEAFLRSGKPAAAGEPLARALELEAEDARAHRLLAQLLLFHEWDWRLAHEHLAESLRLDPGHAAVHQVHAYWLTLNGEMAAAETAMQTALRLDPLSSYVQADAGWIAYWAGRLHTGATRCLRTLELEPESESGRSCLLFVRIAQDDRIGARGAARALMTSRDASPSELTAFDDAQGLESYWSWEVRRLESTPVRSAHDAFLLGLAYAQQGRSDEAFRELEAARRGRTSWMLWLEVEPRLAPLHHDPRWHRLVHRMRLPRAASG